MKQLNHRSIRAFKKKEVPDDILNDLLNIIQRTATSMGMQRSSIIRITDQSVKEKIAVIGNQPYIAEAPEVFIFVVDLHRNISICKEKGVDGSNMANVDSFFQGFTDCVLAAQNLTNAFEEIGLGGVFLGSILNDTNAMIELLNLPKYTFPALGVAFGYPDQDPMLKPRMNMNFRVFENSYNTNDNYLDLLKEYDEEMHQYYDLRNSDKPLPKFTDQVVNTINPFEMKRVDLIKNARKQGFNL